MFRHRLINLFAKIACSLLAALLLCCSLNGQAQAQGNTLRGKVRDSNGRNMARVIVDLQTGNGQPINQTVTNNEGDFYFAGLDETSYIVVISAPDYHPVNQRVEFIRRVTPDAPGETRTEEYTLTPKNNPAPAKPSRPAFAQNVPQAARDAMDRAMKLSREGASQQSIAAMREAIGLFPDYFDAHFALGNELMKAGALDEAIVELDKARQINPKDDRVYQTFGLLLNRQKKFAVAAAVFAEAARLNPSDPNILLLRATALIDHAATLDPSKSEREQTLSEAQKDLNKAFEMSGKKLSTTHLQLARIHEKRGDRAKAANELEQYLRETPDAKNADAIREGVKKLRGAK